MRLGALTLLIATLGTSAVGQSQKLKEAVLQAESRMIHAWTMHDVQTVNALVSDRFVGYGVSGKRLTKSDILRAVHSNDEGSTEVADEQVAIFGETAIYTALITDHLKDERGGNSTVHTRVTDVWVVHTDEARLVASQETEVKK